MNKNKKLNPSISVVFAGNDGQGEFLNSAQHVRINCKRDDYIRNSPLLLFALVGKKKEEEEEEDEHDKPAKKLTLKEIAALKSKTKAAVKALMAMPFTPVKITPAPKLALKNTRMLCSYVSNVNVCVGAITEYSGCNPPVSVCQDIVDALIPLANTPTKDLNTSQKDLLAEFDSKLRFEFTNMILNCATLSNGNLPLFSLTTVATKGKPTKHDKKLAETKFGLSSNHGKGVIAIFAKGIPYAVNYTVYYGPGAVYDPATWKWQNGPARQKVTGLTPGVLYGFVIVANGKLEQGFWAEVQTRNAPFN